MELIMLSPDSKLYEGKVLSVQLPGTEGGFELLDGHAPLIASLAKGQLSFKTDGNQVVRYLIDSGFVECLNNKVSLLLQGVQKVEQSA
jgi:F-type H+-transporting ATPase subunit epsilon